MLFLLICLLGIYQIKEKAALPFKLEPSNGHLLITPNNNYSSVAVLVSVDQYNFNSIEELELYLDGKRTGDQVVISFNSGKTSQSLPVNLINHYTTLDLLIYFLAGTLFLAVGLVTIMKAKQRRIAQLFYAGSTGAALIITLTPGCYTSLPGYIGYITMFIFHSAYALTPVLFVQFILNFPIPRHRVFPLIKLSYLFSFILSAVLTIFFVLAVSSYSSIRIRNYLWVYDNVLRVFVILTFITSIILFWHSYSRINSVPEKKKLKWILLGFLLGPLTFVLFWVLPYLFFGKGALPEQLVISLLCAVPITFAVAIIKYRFFDIDYIFNRSAVYLMVIISVALIYLAVSAFISFFIKGISDTIPVVISTTAAALLLNPARRKAQDIVDKKFFRVQYNYREALRSFLNEIDSCLDNKTLAVKIVNRVNELIPSERIGFFELGTPGDKIKLIAHNNFDILVNRVIIFRRAELKTMLKKPVALTSLAEEGIDIEPANVQVFNRWGIALVFPFTSVGNEISGFLVLGKKKSGVRFTLEDIDLLNAVKSKVATTMERNKYQRELLLEHMEKERLEELNKIKSFIVSRVSHDFRNPLTAISMFTEMLMEEDRNYSPEKVTEYIKIINSESKRLKAMAENVLDFSKIEKGGLEYHFEQVEIKEFVQRVIESMRAQFEINKFMVEVNFSNEELFISADSVGLEAVLLNLISNAIKYSGDRKVLYFSAGRQGENIFVSIKDEGIGISNEDLENIFNPFLRGHNIDPKKIKGAGLGLSIVKHIMDAHKGSVEVASEPGKGSCFTLLFPTVQKSENSLTEIKDS